VVSDDDTTTTTTPDPIPETPDATNGGHPKEMYEAQAKVSDLSV